MAHVLSRRVLQRALNFTLRDKCIINNNRSSFKILPLSRTQSFTLSRIVLPTTSCATLKLRDNISRWYGKKVMPLDSDPPEEKPSLFKRFKQMYKDYWYVLVPVHLVTSAFWFGSFYYMAKSGIDIVGFLKSMHVSEKITDSLKDSSMGYIAISYALYKIATPLRYTVTLGGTTISIKYLKDWGYIKPVPSAQELKSMYQEKKSDVIDAVRGKKVELEQKKEQFKDKKDHLIKDFSQKIAPVKTVKK